MSKNSLLFPLERGEQNEPRYMDRTAYVFDVSSDDRTLALRYLDKTKVTAQLRPLNGYLV